MTFQYSEIKNEHLQFIITYYSRSGLRSSSGFIQKFISVYVLYPLFLIFYTLVILNFRYKHDTIFDFVEIFSSVSSFANLLSRKTALVVDGHLFDDIIKEIPRFWKYDLCGKNDEKNKYSARMALCVKFIKFLWISGVVSLTFHSSAPIFVKEMSLPHACWIPGDIFAFRVIIYTLEVIFYIEVVFLLGVFDGFYLLMCTELKIQLELLEKAVNAIEFRADEDLTNENKCWEKLKECSRYHKFLLRSSSLTQVVEGAFIIVLANVLIAMVFIPSSLVEIEAEQLSYAIYNIDWYNAKLPKNRKFVLFWLRQTQIPLEMTGAGILKINRPVMLQIQRLGFSVSSLLAGLT
ncbi:odorant receptor Or2-like [Zophobas morio]|uniref:odorant receptor Or2-like n=1 Tax=Zophobas morio TaxID=2755281 RepID=UPI003082EBEE